MHSFVDYTQANRNSPHGNRRQIYFVICESCFWCASAPSPRRVRNETISKCPSCEGDRISITPILGG
jgi:hypothetical protein